MQLLARTRYNKPIWIDWCFDKNGDAIAIFQEFESLEEEFDAWAVFATVAVKATHRNDESIFKGLYYAAEDHYGPSINNPEKYTEIEADMGIKGAADRATYGRSLLRPEFT